MAFVVFYCMRSQNFNDNYEYEIIVLCYNGIYYKVQIVVVGNFDLVWFGNIVDFGIIQMEFIIEWNFNWVMFVDFFFLLDVWVVLSKVKVRGYSGVYFIEYINGECYGWVC